MARQALRLSESGEVKEENEPQMNATERSEMDEHFNSGNESNGH
jgi:hypothetical protein